MSKRKMFATKKELESLYNEEKISLHSFFTYLAILVLLLFLYIILFADLRTFVTILGSTAGGGV